MDIFESYIKTIKEILTCFKGLRIEEVSYPLPGKLNDILEKLFQVSKGVCFLSEETFDEIHRLTINKRVLDGSNERIHEIDKLSYPPKEKITKYGRCNMPNQSVLYGTFSMLGVLAELKPDSGDMVTHSVWRLKNPNQTITTCSIYKNQPQSQNGIQTVNLRSQKIDEFVQRELKQFPPNLAIIFNELIAFTADAFSKNVTNDHREYFFSAYFASKFFEELQVDAICYPSVQMNLGFENVAIRPSAFDIMYDLVEVRDSIVNNMRNGGYMLDGLSDCKKFDYSAGKILWGK